MKFRFWFGLAAGTVSSIVTAAIPAVQGYWLLVGATVALLVWFGEFLWDGVRVFLGFLD